MHHRDRILLIFLLLVIIPLSYAQPPFQSSEDLSNELAILFPKHTAYKVGDTLNLHYHIYNSTGALLNTTQTNCYLHAYASNGSHVIEQELSNDGNGLEKSIIINSSITSYEGEFPYTVYCNSTQGEFGFISGVGLTTNSGKYDETAGYKWFSVALIASMIALLFFLLANGIKENKGMRTIKLLFFLLAVINTFMLGFIIYAITLNPFDLISFRTIALSYFSINMILLILFIFLYGYYLLTDLFNKEEV